MSDTDDIFMTDKITYWIQDQILWFKFLAIKKKKMFVALLIQESEYRRNSKTDFHGGTDKISLKTYHW